jgi:cytochrome c553
MRKESAEACRPPQIVTDLRRKGMRNSPAGARPVTLRKNSFQKIWIMGLGILGLGILGLGILGLGCGALLFSATAISAEEFPDWAYPPLSPAVGPFDATVLKEMPGSTKKFTQAQIEDDFNPPDWFPQDHPPMPPVVANGRPPAVKACSKCHVTNGMGHPESSDLAGLPVAYIQRQMADLKEGARKSKRTGSMLLIAKAISDEEVLAAAAYYNALKPIVWTTVVETQMIPKSRLGIGAMRYPIENAGQEPLGDRIIELPRDPKRTELHDSRMGFIAYVPIGSIAKGAAMVTSGGDGKTQPCATCHGTDLKGIGEVPRIAGRSPIYVFRQLNDIKAGTRAGPMAAPMQQVVANLSQDDMLVIAAYLGSLKP